MFRNPLHPDRRGFFALATAAATAIGCSCGRALAQQQPNHGHIPGAEKSTKSTMLGIGADLLQNDSPISAINMYLNGFHFYADDMGRQVEAHHYCSHVNEDFFQCVIYDGSKPDSRLIGIEYIVSERLFKTLPDDEKPLWHSHRHETTSGELVMPGIPGAVEHTAIASLVSTYGKTWHTWQIDKNSSLPTGLPQLMMGFTADGQLKPAMIERRDEALGVSTTETRSARSDLAKSAPQPDPLADGWKKGTAKQLILQDMPLKNKP
ncbi:OBAP family protein [Rhizobium leguminosarum]|uniref:OBAP family protein n=1 Tax=Rhizobium leguminosarum TaxID=384 RepID=UPI001C953CF0|nr:OBAP family protein [Rhizobium leguminosarum]MBY5580875.1 OBAP family protein [Rhizobium leguminosarum]MBY5587101.1 OBAP family protein [Rhizobium leguminosarum]MBY5601999.1 OBAP family protein [Rhizobium leguminosarum]